MNDRSVSRHLLSRLFQQTHYMLGSAVLEQLCTTLDSGLLKQPDKQEQPTGELFDAKEATGASPCAVL